MDLAAASQRRKSSVADRVPTRENEVSQEGLLKRLDALFYREELGLDRQQEPTPRRAAGLLPFSTSSLGGYRPAVTPFGEPWELWVRQAHSEDDAPPVDGEGHRRPRSLGHHRDAMGPGFLEELLYLHSTAGDRN
jgi:hypothetical protein